MGPPLWNAAYREEAWQRLGEGFDVIVIGGGITGAGIAHLAAAEDLRVLLVEQRDFAWGSSSRSSKMVHGGLRYLRQGDFRLTRASITERDRLVREAPGLVDPVGFLMAVYGGARPGRRTFGLGLAIYDILALRWAHAWHAPDDFTLLAPHLRRPGLEGGFHYEDALTDDARLVLRVLREAAGQGAVVLNYVQAQDALRAGGRAVGARLQDVTTRRTCEVPARVVVNATGAWADRLRASRRIRPLRGSHLTFPAWRMPLAQAVSCLHPADGRPLVMIPWEGVTLVGTTDVDHTDSLDVEPSITPREVDYLLDAVQHLFPALELTEGDVVSTFAGVRPVVGTGKADPSKESREHAIWDDLGLVTVTGGKLTTFQRIAHDALRVALRHVPQARQPTRNPPALDAVAAGSSLDGGVGRRLLGRYGAEAPAVVDACGPGFAGVPGTPALWGELRWAARAEGVVHLDDLLLRRTRVGLLLASGAVNLLPAVETICREELGWDASRWASESEAYQTLWGRHYSLPQA